MEIILIIAIAAIVSLLAYTLLRLFFLVTVWAGLSVFGFDDIVIDGVVIIDEQDVTVEWLAANPNKWAWHEGTKLPSAYLVLEAPTRYEQITHVFPPEGGSLNYTVAIASQLAMVSVMGGFPVLLTGLGLPEDGNEAG